MRLLLVEDNRELVAELLPVLQQAILPFLANRGVRRVSHLVVSHADLDHSGGTEALVSAIEVERIIAGEQLPGIEARPCLRGQRWWQGGIEFEILHPPSLATYEGNNASCVLRVAAGPHALLLTGDVEQVAERQLLRAKLESRIKAEAPRPPTPLPVKEEAETTDRTVSEVEQKEESKDGVPVLSRKKV